MLLIYKLRAISSPKVVKPQLNGASAPIPLDRSKWLEEWRIAYLNFLQIQLDKLVSKTNGEAILALAQLSYASHLQKSSKKAKH